MNTSSIYFGAINTSVFRERKSQGYKLTQTERIAEFFSNNPGNLYTPFEVQDALATDAPITSIRRAMSDLTRKGFLIKTSEQRLGELGNLNYCWKLNE